MLNSCKWLQNQQLHKTILQLFLYNFVYFVVATNHKCVSYSFMGMYVANIFSLEMITNKSISILSVIVGTFRNIEQRNVIRIMVQFFLLV